MDGHEDGVWDGLCVFMPHSHSGETRQEWGQLLMSPFVIKGETNSSLELYWTKQFDLVILTCD